MLLFIFQTIINEVKSFQKYMHFFVYKIYIFQLLTLLLRNLPKISPDDKSDDKSCMMYTLQIPIATKEPQTVNLCEGYPIC